MLDTNTLNFNCQRVLDNLLALETLSKHTPEVPLLKKYTGWGGLNEAIYCQPVSKALKDLISESELQGLKKSTKTAYYTPEFIINVMYKFVNTITNRPIKHILEPSAGHGNFIEYMPASLRDNAKITAVEIDKLTCRFLSNLYPDINVIDQGFESVSCDTLFDLVIGNPPYGQMKLQDSHHQDLSKYSIQHYFVAKSFRLLKPGGILAMVVPRYFLDNPMQHVRTLLAEEGAELKAAFRLPSDVFSDAKVTVDLVFFQKSMKTTSSKDWEHATAFFQNDKRPYINRYYLNNPDHVLGKLTSIELYGRLELECQRQYSNSELIAKLEKRMENLVGSSINVVKVEQYLNKKLINLKQQMKTVQSEIRYIESLIKQLSFPLYHRVYLSEFLFLGLFILLITIIVIMAAPKLSKMLA